MKRKAADLLAVLPSCNGLQPLQPLRQKPWARPTFTDASGKAGGWVSPTGQASRKFRARERRACTAVLEAKMVQERIAANADKWSGHVVPFYVPGQHDRNSVLPEGAFYKQKAEQHCPIYNDAFGHA